MYKPQIYQQLPCADFDQLVSLKNTPENRWIKKMARITWIELEKNRLKNLLIKKTILRNFYEWLWVPY
ncbi:hypothetical protein [Enterococcus lemanii]|uniref:Uncharacterized protein n=1 Tax=Enterococcus lemanii TaxID=1159752 RepID=A0ABV9MVI7_9ENTE|nr:hypothetical protein [Enterococcus lemanii]MBM7709742.1 hypothetical protein [Enterococcus lemanii]